MIDRFISRAGGLWAQAQNHAFVLGIESGTLDPAAFKFYLVEDYLYLTAYSRAVAALAFRAPNLGLMKEMSGLLHSTLFTEMETHRAYAAKFGIAPEELGGKSPAPATLRYNSYMEDVAIREDFLGNLVCLIPCAAGYAEIGRRIKSKQDAAPELSRNQYQEWIDTYASGEFQNYAFRMKETADSLGDGLPEPRKDELYAIFETSTRFELLFFDMALNRDDAPGV